LTDVAGLTVTETAMTLPVIANVIRVSVFGTVEGGVGWSNTFHLIKDASTTYAAAIGAAQTEVTTLYSSTGYGGGKEGWGEYATDGSHTAQVIYTPLDGTTASTTFAMVQSGQSSQEPTSPQNAISCTINTGLRGRSNRGRVFWACTSREILSGGKVAAANVASINACWKQFNDNLIASGAPSSLAVASYLHSSVHAADPTRPVSAHATLAHQTKRRGAGA